MSCRVQEEVNSELFRRANSIRGNSFLPPDVEITVGSLVTVHGNEMKVVGVKPFYLSTKMSHLEVNLQ